MRVAPAPAGVGPAEAADVRAVAVDARADPAAAGPAEATDVLVAAVAGPVAAAQGGPAVVVPTEAAAAPPPVVAVAARSVPPLAEVARVGRPVAGGLPVGPPGTVSAAAEAAERPPVGT